MGNLYTCTNWVNARDSFNKAGSYDLQAWAFIYNAWQETGASRNAFAIETHGRECGDVVLNASTTNKYLGLIEWGLSFLGDGDEDDSDVLEVLSSFNSVRDIERVKRENGAVKVRATSKKKSDVVESEVARIRKMSKAEQARLRKALGW